MTRTETRHICLIFLLAVILMMSFVVLTGCQSTDKNETYIDTSNLQSAQFDYDEVVDRTEVVWTATITNGTIYNLKDFAVTFKLYNETDLIKTATYHYERDVRHGAEYKGSFSFNVEGKVDSMEYVSWTANHLSFWDTYKIWMIVMIVLVGVAAIIYTIVMIIEDLDPEETFDEIVDFFEDHLWMALLLLIPAAGVVWGIISSYWVPILIVLGGIIAFVLLALIAHLVKFIVECIADRIVCLPTRRGAAQAYGDEEDGYFDSANEDVADYVDDKDTLMLFTVGQLKEYCRDNGVKGYSSLNKAELVELIAADIDKSAAAAAEREKPRQKEQKKISGVTFDDIAGLEDAKKAFREKVVYAFSHKELYEKYGKKVGGGLLLYGLPGTGKTMFAEAASNETDSLFIPVKCSDIKSKWYGESEAKVKSIFEKARKAKRAIIFFDEFEAIGAKRTDSSDNGNNDLVPQILAEMQGVGSSSEDCIIMVIAATNKPWSIDSAFLRPGRFDEKIYIPLPDFAARKKLFELKLKSVPKKDLDFDHLADITDGFNGADIGAFCDKLKMIAINKSIVDGGEWPITMQEVAQVKENIKSSVSDEDVEQLLEFKKHYG